MFEAGDHRITRGLLPEARSDQPTEWNTPATMFLRITAAVAFQTAAGTTFSDWANPWAILRVYDTNGYLAGLDITL